jgi:CheY-like chemotaxis protein
MMIHELATNAFRHGALTAQAGRVHLSWSGQPDGLITMAWAESGGPPVQPPLHTGFGSHLIQQIVEHQLSGKLEHHWGIDGYRLELTLPASILELASERRSPGRAASKGSEPVPARQSGQTDSNSHLGTLLIVEDEPLLAMQLSRSLTEFGWSIFGVAGSIEEANRILSENRRPDAAILDVDLAGMPVFPLARSLRRLGIPFLFCTGYEDLDYVQEFAGCQTIRKPATVLQIVRGLRDVVRTAGAELTSAPNR